MWQSFKEYITALGRWGWIILVEIILGLAGAYIDISRTAGFPTWLWIVLLCTALVISPFLAFHKLRKQRDEIQLHLNNIKNSTPNIIFKKAGEWPYYTNGQATYHALQVWFTNNPQVASDNSVAKDVTAVIEFYDSNTKNILEIYGCFTEAEVPDYATIRNLKDKIDVWSPNDIPQKLLIALKYKGDDSAYGFAKSNFLVIKDGRESAKEIVKGEHYVKIAFKGIGVNQLPLWFRLNNPGQNGDLSISSPIQKPDLRK